MVIVQAAGKHSLREQKWVERQDFEFLPLVVIEIAILQCDDKLRIGKRKDAAKYGLI